MQGNVFQGYDESPDKQQFTKTLEALSTYISTHMDFPKDVASICKKMKRDIIQETCDLTEEELKSATKKMIWKTIVHSCVRRIEAQEKNFESIFAIIWGQCSTSMKNKLQSLDGYLEGSDTYDCV